LGFEVVARPIVTTFQSASLESADANSKPRTDVGSLRAGGGDLPTDSLRDRISELLVAEKRDFETRQRAMTVHPITGKPLRKDDVIAPFPKGATDTQMDSFSRRTHMSLPTSLREWLKITNGAAGLYGVRPTQPGRDIETVWERYPEFRSQAWLPVADDGFGNFYIEPACEAVCFVEVGHSLNTVAYVVASDMLYFASFMLEDRLGLHRQLAESKGIDIRPAKTRLRRGGCPPKTNPWPFNREYMMARNPDLKFVKGLPFAWE